jgi:hypothetical protein
MSPKVALRVASVDDARRELCHQLTHVIREGATGMQVRIVTEGETSKFAWIYTQQQHEWKKRDDLVLSSAVIEPIQVLLEGLFKQEYSDAWTCHRHDHRDRTDFELKFCRESIEPHVKADLESYLNGCLSHAHHDSGHDSRRRMGFRNQ